MACSPTWTMDQFLASPQPIIATRAGKYIQGAASRWSTRSLPAHSPGEFAATPRRTRTWECSVSASREPGLHGCVSCSDGLMLVIGANDRQPNHPGPGGTRRYQPAGARMTPRQSRSGRTQTPTLSTVGPWDGPGSTSSRETRANLAVIDRAPAYVLNPARFSPAQPCRQPPLRRCSPPTKRHPRDAPTRTSC